MKQMMGLVLTVVVVAALTAWATAPGPRADYAALQRGDLGAMIDGAVNLPTKMRANAADSGAATDIANYSSVAVVLATGQIDITSGVKYVVLQDSTPGTAAWNLIDSVAVDSTDNKYYDLTYKGFRRHVRLFQRASGAAADTLQVTGLIVRSGKRSR